MSKGGYLQVGVQPYGGGLWHTWFDRDLTIAGRVMIREEKDASASYSHRLVRLEEPIMRIPTLAIHLDRSLLHFVIYSNVILCGNVFLILYCVCSSALASDLSFGQRCK